MILDANRCRRHSTTTTTTTTGGSGDISRSNNNNNFDWISASAWTFYGINVSFVAILLAKCNTQP